MAKLTSEVSRMSYQPMLLDLTDATWFAGIGVWDYALNLAGWPDDRQVWTGSCPCQPFSAAGKGGGFADERHLWPAWFHLINICRRPDTVFGEQVASKTDLLGSTLFRLTWKASAYTIGAVDIPVAGVRGAAQAQRFTSWQSRGCGPQGVSERLSGQLPRERSDEPLQIAERSPTSDLAESCSERLHGERLRLRSRQSRLNNSQVRRCGETGELAVTDGGNTGTERELGSGQQRQQPQNSGISKLAVTTGRQQRRLRERDTRCKSGELQTGGLGPANSFWSDAEWIYCRDEKYRATKPGIFPLADGIPGRVGLLRGAGNAISPWAAKAFIESWQEVRLEHNSHVGEP
jgi:DNA (cytosine-5)-methyltransferase 1